MPKIDLSNPARRNALPPRSSYYSHAIGSKRYVLLRVGKRGATWGARVAGRADKALGPVDSMDFDAVADLVRKLAGETCTDAAMTIGAALDLYVASCEATKGDRPMTTIRSHVKQCRSLRDLTIATTSKARLVQWRNGLITPERGVATANKIVGTLKAALNLAGVDGEWSKLDKMKEPRRGVSDRAAVLSAEQVRSILSEIRCPDFADFVRALWTTGARPDELMTARRDALSGDALTLTGKTGTRTINLRSDLFQHRAAMGHTHLLTLNGKVWTTRTYLSRWHKLQAVPDGVTPYALRHGFITAGLYAGVPVFAIAAHCGTSVEMIQRTYGHVLVELQGAALARMDAVLDV